MNSVLQKNIKDGVFTFLSDLPEHEKPKPGQQPSFMGQTAVASPSSLYTTLRHCLMPTLHRYTDPSINDCLVDTPNIGMPECHKYGSQRLDIK